MTRFLILRAACRLLSKLPKRWLLEIAPLGAFMVALAIWIVLTLFLQPMISLLVLVFLVSGVLCLKDGGRRLKMLKMRREANMLTETVQCSDRNEMFLSWAQWPVEASTRKAVEVAQKAGPNEEVVIGHVDNDGRVLGVFGELPGLENIEKASFVERYRYPIDIVITKEKVLIRKDFRGDRKGFVREWHNLARLHGKANVPTVYRVDEDHCLLYKSFVVGETLRAILVRAGAKILSVQTDNDPELDGIEGDSRIEAIWERGSALVPLCFSEDFLNELEIQLDKIHQCGVAGLSLTFGNIIMDSNNGAPWFIDFDGARAYRSVSDLRFIYRCEQDRMKFNTIYNRNLETLGTTKGCFISDRTSVHNNAITRHRDV